MEFIELIMTWLKTSTLAISSLSVLVLLLAALLTKLISKRLLRGALIKSLRAPKDMVLDPKADLKFIPRLTNILPALVISEGIRLIQDLPPELVTIISNIGRAFVILMLAMALDNVLTLLNKIYEQRPEAKVRPMKGYFQVVIIAGYVIASIFIIAMLMDRSPLILLSGLGAMAAVLMLIFQDTLLSLVASVQISSNDIIRVGDWIEMPQLNADGDVIDIALHTVKVQNWDKTITTIPTKRFISDSFKNWRGMRESGGRRIKRSIMIDQQSVHFLNAEQRQKLQRFRLLTQYLSTKQADIDAWNEQLKEQGMEPVNTRRITNLGTFRAYIYEYLRSHPGIHQGMTLMSRQMPPTAEGLPLEVYCFTNTVVWTEYESIQSDIFDHLIAIISEFGLRIYQQPSGHDMRDMVTALHDEGHSAS